MSKRLTLTESQFSLVVDAVAYRVVALEDALQNIRYTPEEVRDRQARVRELRALLEDLWRAR